MQYSKQKILDIVNHQLLFWIKKDEAVKGAVFELIQSKHPTKKETNDKFDKMLTLFREERIKHEKKWEAQEKKWEVQEKKWEVQEKKWEVQEKKWEENQKTINAILEEIKKDREEQSRKWDENQIAIKAGNSRHDQSLGAIGTRWGLRTEASFRNALKEILGEIHSEYKVIHYKEFDDEGIVFDEPSPVEIDVIVKNGKVYLIEIKSSAGKDELYVFTRKRKFYEKKHNLKVHQMIVISPMMDDHGKQFAKEKKIKLYTYADDVKL